MGTDPKGIGGKLRQHRMRALALRCRTGRDDDLAGRADPHIGALEWPATGALDVVRQPDADEPTRAPRRLAPRRKIAIARRCKRATLAFGVVAAIVGHRQAV